MSGKLNLGDLERIPLDDGMSWLSIRRTLGVTGFSVNGYVAEKAGDTVIETHDETGSGSGGHEELYLVAQGRAAFTVGGDEMELGPGEMVFVDPETTRGRNGARGRHNRPRRSRASRRCAARLALRALVRRDPRARGRRPRGRIRDDREGF